MKNKSKKYALSPKQALQAAIDIVGGQTEFERKTGIRQQRFSDWLHTDTKVPADVCLIVARHSKIPPEWIRPDLALEFEALRKSVSPPCERAA